MDEFEFTSKDFTSEEVGACVAILGRGANNIPELWLGRVQSIDDTARRALKIKWLKRPRDEPCDNMWQRSKISASYHSYSDVIAICYEDEACSEPHKRKRRPYYMTAAEWQAVNAVFEARQ